MDFVVVFLLGHSRLNAHLYETGKANDPKMKQGLWSKTAWNDQVGSYFEQYNPSLHK